MSVTFSINLSVSPFYQDECHLFLQPRPQDTSRTRTHANLAAVGWVLRGFSEQYSGFQTVIVLYGLPILKEMTAWKPGYPAYGREISVG